MRDLGRELVEVVEWHGDRPAKIALTEAGRELVARAIPLVNANGVEHTARVVLLAPHQLRILMTLAALSAAEQSADAEHEQPTKEDTNG